MGLLGSRELLERFSRLEERQQKLEERFAELEERVTRLEESHQMRWKEVKRLSLGSSMGLSTGGGEEAPPASRR